tara:strand:- start:380 stop:745 length:366 start_codon:yes stop_codon:yes gene_type:complete
MHVRLQKSPRFDKKYRVTFKNGRVVDFGAKGYSDYTKHKNPFRMRSYVTRHGGYVPYMVQKQADPNLVHLNMLDVTKSDKENWGKTGFYTAGFWSRWLLWSHPNLENAKKLITKKYGLVFK